MLFLASILYISLSVSLLAHVKIRRNKGSLTNIISSISLLICAIILFFYPRYQQLLPIASLILTIILALFLLSLRIISKLVSKILSINNNDSAYKEIIRKAFHFFVLILILPREYLFSVYQSGILIISSVIQYSGGEIIAMTTSFLRDAIIIVSGSAVFIFIIFEFLRINFGIVLYPNILIRSIEEKSIAAHVYTALSIFLISLIFPEHIIIPSIIIPTLQDAMAAIIGRSLGKKVIVKGRTLEGCAAGFITSIALGILFLDILTTIMLAVILVIFDFLSNALNINDNLLFPIVSAIYLQALTPA